MSNNKNNTFIDYKYICIKKDKFDVNVMILMDLLNYMHHFVPVELKIYQNIVQVVFFHVVRNIISLYVNIMKIILNLNIFL